MKKTICGVVESPTRGSVLAKPGLLPPEGTKVTITWDSLMIVHECYHLKKIGCRMRPSESGYGWYLVKDSLAVVKNLHYCPACGIKLD